MKHVNAEEQQSPVKSYTSELRNKYERFQGYVL